eukprot:gene3738-6626_t
MSLLDCLQQYDKSSMKQVKTVETNLIDIIGEKDEVTTSHLTQQEITEHFDDEATLKKNVKELTKLIKKSKHVVVYTGAGISTSAKIPDFRGPKGVWTLKDQGKTIENTVSVEQALPTYAHYALKELINKGFVKHIVSTNCDGLHRRSGINGDDLSELHGNLYKEDCIKCEKEHFRNYCVTSTVEEPWTHLTGRHCEICKGMLRDTVVAFGEQLPKKELSKAIATSKQADLTIILGSSMRVSPACELPFYNSKCKNVIVNLQITPYDKQSTIRSFSKTDEFLEQLMKELQLIEFDRSFDILEK